MKKTTQHMERHFYWPSMQPQFEKIIRACALCSQSKPSNRKHGLYQPLPLPSRPWESISMDFLSGLPTTQKKHDAIWVVVCLFRKMALFIPCTNTTTISQTTKLYFLHVWPHFGLPRSIISDRYSRFLSTFWNNQSPSLIQWTTFLISNSHWPKTLYWTLKVALQETRPTLHIW
jgi:hypothetical protein